MSNELQNTVELSAEEKALLTNDLSKLTVDQRSNLYMKVCQSVGLNPLTQPFSYILLNGKTCLYATRNCTDQLRSIHKVSLAIKSRDKVDDLYIVSASATLSSGRCDESIGAVTLTGLKGDGLANAIMKCETKAKRRVTLSICGLSFLDETEVETIKDAKPVDMPRIERSSSPHPIEEIDVFIEQEDFAEAEIDTERESLSLKLESIVKDRGMKPKEFFMLVKHCLGVEKTPRDMSSMELDIVARFIEAPVESTIAT